MNLGLVRLAFRRALARTVILLWVALSLLALTREWAGSNALLQAAQEGVAPGAVERGTMREGVWTVLAIALLPLFVARAARIVAIWRAGEGEWLGSRITGRASILVSTWLGGFAGGALILVLSCLAIEVRVGSPGAEGASSPSLRRAGSIAVPSAAWIDSSSPLSWRVGDAPAGARARIELGFGASSGSAAEVVCRARREGSERSSRSRISSRGAAEVEIPPGRGEVEFELSCSRPGTRAFVISDAAELWVPCSSDRAAGAAILLRILLALATWEALAIGLGAWVSAPTAVLALLSAWVLVWFGDSAPGWLPGADLWDALEAAGRGRVGQALDPRALATGAALCLAGLGLAAAGLGRWRASP